MKGWNMSRTKSLKHKKVLVNPARCVGCRSCELACAVAHSASRDLYEMARAGERPGYRITIESLDNQPIPVHCAHCENAACQAACPTGAIYREEANGPVLFVSERCIGCRMCLHACPFGVITVHPLGSGILKCDQCIERLEQGQQPACTEGCPTGALIFGDDDDVAREKRRQSAQRLMNAQAENVLKG